MLPKDAHVKGVFTSSRGLLSIQETSPEKRFIDCSTIDPKSSLDVGKAVADSGLARFVDALVSCGPNSAYASTLTFMVGGARELFQGVEPILRTTGKKRKHLPVWIGGRRTCHKAVQQLPHRRVHHRSQ